MNLERIVNVEVPKSEEVAFENIIDGQLESVEYAPIYKEGLTFEFDGIILEFTYDESNDINNALTSVTKNGDRLDINILEFHQISEKLFNNIKIV